MLSYIEVIVPAYEIAKSQAWMIPDEEQNKEMSIGDLPQILAGADNYKEEIWQVKSDTFWAEEMCRALTRL